MRSFLLAVPVVSLALALAGCVTSDTPAEVTPLESYHAGRMNEGIAALKKDPRLGGHISSGTSRKLERLYADKPEYLALKSRDKSQRQVLPRVRSVTPPASQYGEGRGTVKVAFIVDEQGRVRDPRVFESSNSKFDEAALAAIRKWTFHPGAVAGSPAKFIFVMPFHFMPLSGLENWKMPGNQGGDTAAALRVSP